MTQLIDKYSATAFVGLTFLLSGTALGLCVLLFGTSPLNHPGALPLGLLVVWGPNLAAFVLARRDKGSAARLLRSVLAPARLRVWLAASAPLAVGVFVARAQGDVDWGAVDPQSALLLVTINLLMGPLGEELGWRGYLLPRLIAKTGTLGAGISLGFVWALWHGPLWWLETPHREIPFSLFAPTVVCFSVYMTAIYVAARGALGPVIVFHLFANVAMNWVALVGVPTEPAFQYGLFGYGLLSAGAAIWLGLIPDELHHCRTRQPWDFSFGQRKSA